MVGKFFKFLFSEKNSTLYEELTTTNPRSSYEEIESYSSSTWPEASSYNVSLYHGDDQSLVSLENSKKQGVALLVAYLVPLLFGLIFIMGILGNVVVIVVTARTCKHFNQQTREFTNRFLLNLAVADLLFLFFCVPFHATVYSMEGWPFGPVLCILTEFFQKLSMVASVYTLVALSIDRYFAVVYATRTRHYQTKINSYICLFCIWCLALLFGTLAAFTREEIMSLGIMVCIVNEELFSHAAFVFLVFILAYVVPLILIFFCYAGLVRAMAENARKRIIHKNKNSLDPTKKVTKIVIVIVIAFAADWFLYHLLKIWMTFDSFQYTTTTFILKLLGHCFSYANSCINPMIYAFISKKFRRELKNTIRGCNWRRRSNLSPTDRQTRSRAKNQRMNIKQLEVKQRKNSKFKPEHTVIRNCYKEESLGDISTYNEPMLKSKLTARTDQDCSIMTESLLNDFQLSIQVDCHRGVVEKCDKPEEKNEIIFSDCYKKQSSVQSKKNNFDVNKKLDAESSQKDVIVYLTSPSQNSSSWNDTMLLKNFCSSETNSSKITLDVENNENNNSLLQKK